MSFIPTENTPFYRVRICGCTSGAPMMAKPDPSREVVDPFLDDSGQHVLRMQPLGPLHYLDSSLPRDCAELLERKAAQVEEGVLNFPNSNNQEFCFLVMMAWHLVDDSASLPYFYRFCSSLRLWLVDHEIWAIVVTFRNFYVLRDHMSSDAVSRYINSFDKLVSVLEGHRCVVHSSYTPID